MRTQVRYRLGVAVALEPGETAGATNFDVGHHVLPVTVAVAVAPPEPHHQRHP